MPAPAIVPVSARPFEEIYGSPENLAAEEAGLTESPEFEAALSETAATEASANMAAYGGFILSLLAISAAVIITTKINGDDQKRAAFTNKFVTDASKQTPHWNVVMCHTSHTATPDPKAPGSYVRHQHVELGMTLGTCGYDIYFSPKGKPFTFVNHGDGGFINWAFNGEFNRNGNTLTAAQHA